MKLHRLILGLVLLVLLVLARAVPAAGGCRRVVAVGDLHGGYEAFVAILQEAGLLDRDLEWTGAGACLVQLGDVVDRGAHSREILDLMIELQQVDPDHVHLLLGNHEVMNIIGDLRYATSEEFRAFADEETPGQRERGFRVYRRRHDAGAADSAELRARFDREFPPGWFAHREAFSPDGRYGSWLLKRKATLILLDSLFVHGGLDAADAARGLEAVNHGVRKQIKKLLRTREFLIDAGVLDVLTGYADALKAVAREAARLDALPPSRRDPRLMRALRDFERSKTSDLYRAEGPLWNRDLALADEADYRPEVDAVLEELSVERIVVGHTTQDPPRIRARFDDRVFLVDTGAGPAYGGVPSALEIRADGAVTAVYIGRRQPLVAAPETSGAGPGPDTLPEPAGVPGMPEASGVPGSGLVSALRGAGVGSDFRRPLADGGRDTAVAGRQVPE